MRNGLLLLLVSGLLLIACEPLAPNTQGQQVVVITGTPAPATVTTTPLLATPLPTRPGPSPTPTIVLSPSPTLPPCTEAEGRIIDSVLDSEIAGELLNYQMYLPPCFFLTARRYPYVILLHGSGFRETQWTQDLDLQAVMDAGLQDSANPLAQMVLIMPEGGDLHLNNIFTEGASFEDVVLRELIPDIERQFCLWDTAEGRAIGGISRGGFWAFSIGLRHPDMFSAIGGHSAALFPNNAPTTHNPMSLAEITSSALPIRLYMDIAQGDPGEPNLHEFSNNLRVNDVEHIYDISAAGGHNNAYWAERLPSYLQFYGESWPKSAGELPSCF